MTLSVFDHSVYPNIKSHLRACIQQAPEQGAVFEFGVFRGKSIRAIAKEIPNRRIFGFDSFCGLPEDWERSEGDTYHKGHFDTELPTVPNNVTLIEGFFDQTLESFLEQHPHDSVAFLHIDSDLYSSAIYILRTLNHLIRPGTIIVFDELCDWTGQHIYDFWKEGEWKALNEWVVEFDREYEPLSRTEEYAAAIKVTK